MPLALRLAGQSLTNAELAVMQINGGAGVVLGTNAHIHGVILAEKGVTVKTGTSVSGRIFAQSAVTLDKNVISATAP